MNQTVLVPVVGMALVLGACGGESPAGPGPDPGPVARDTLTTPIQGGLLADLYYGAYYDHGGTGPTDYQCGVKAYAGHAGVDILLKNFAAMDQGRAVIAAAPGIVESVHDGDADRNTSNGAGGFGNHVIVAHPGGLRSIYAHLRIHTITVAAGQTVQRGEQLGLAGSSGNSNWPHLHFEVQRSAAPFDPFTGSCATAESVWRSQLAYQDSFLVIDHGLTDVAQLTFAQLLERPPGVTNVPTTTTSVVTWSELFNVRATAMRVELLDSAGVAVTSVTSGPVQTFSARFFAVEIDVAGFLSTLGHYTIRHLQDRGAGFELLFTQQFNLVDGGVAVPPARMAGRGKIVFLGEDGGDR